MLALITLSRLNHSKWFNRKIPPLSVAKRTVAPVYRSTTRGLLHQPNVKSYACTPAEKRNDRSPIVRGFPENNV